MASLRQDLATRISTEASQTFVNEYYAALNTSRDNIQSFYMDQSVMPDGKILPAIVFNGNIIPDAPAMQKLFKEQMPQTRYEVQSFDCHVLNPEHIVDGAQAAPSGSGRNMTILLTVSGFVKYGESRSASPRGFSETLILVPNMAPKSNVRGRRHQDWVIQSQTFRQVT